MAIRVLPSPQAARAWCETQRAAGKSVGFIPTMGGLHDGHLALVKRAVGENDCACVSIFVNPLQFNSSADLHNYPRDFERDSALLAGADCQMLFTGSLGGFFPEARSPDEIVARDAGPAGRGLEGEFRPGHLDGVCAIVERLFRTVGACTAYFGEKDFQQTLVVRDLAAQMDGIRVVVCPTVRDQSGLALSSRNQRLSGAQKRHAVALYRALVAAKRHWRNGLRHAAELETRMRAELAATPLRVEYAAVRDPHNWSAAAPAGELRHAQGLVAAWLGEVRLIDTLALHET